MHMSKLGQFLVDEMYVQITLIIHICFKRIANRLDFVEALAGNTSAVKGNDSFSKIITVYSKQKL